MHIDPRDTLHTRRDAAERMRCSERTIDRLVKSGRLRTVKLGRLTRIPDSALSQLLTPN